jgi:hypothetical protein
MLSPNKQIGTTIEIPIAQALMRLAQRNTVNRDFRQNFYKIKFFLNYPLNTEEISVPVRPAKPVKDLSPSPPMALRFFP